MIVHPHANSIDIVLQDESIHGDFDRNLCFQDAIAEAQPVELLRYTYRRL
jgi:hypothetical protein